jgi:hypothetical protein
MGAPPDICAEVAYNGTGGKMGNLISIAAIVAAALAIGFAIGWLIGRRIQRSDLKEDILRDEALRENAQFDFGLVRAKAHEIARLANEIAQQASRAHDTVRDPHADVGQPPGLPDEPKTIDGIKMSDASSMNAAAVCAADR